MRRLWGLVGLALVLAAALAAGPAAAQLPLGCTRYSYEDTQMATQRCEGETRENERRAAEYWKRIEEGKQLLAEVRSRPNLPLAQNRLIGRWQAPSGPRVNMDAKDLFSGLLEADKILKGGMCGLLFGNGGQVEFTPTGWVSTDATGRDDLGPVTYKAVAPGVVGVLPAQGIQNMIFEFVGPNQVKIVGDTAGCTLTRIGAAPGPVAGAGGRPAAPTPPTGGARPPGSQQALNAPAPPSASNGRPPPEVCRRAFLDELGRARADQVRETIAQRFASSRTGVTPGTQNLRLMGRDSPCDDPRIGGIIYDFDAAGLLRQVIISWEGARGARFADTAALLARFATAPPRAATATRTEGLTSLYRYVVEDRPDLKVVTVTYTPLAP